jgi:hypothetical protein
MGLGSGIRDPDKISPGSDPGVKKAPDPGSGSATLLIRVYRCCRRGARLDPRAVLQEGAGCQPHQQRSDHTGRVADQDSIGSVDPDPDPRGQK